MTDTNTLDQAADTHDEDGFDVKLSKSPVNIFQGTNSVIGAGLATAVTGSSKPVEAHSEIRYQLCLDSETLAETLDITQSANVSFGLFGSSEKTEFLKKTKRTTYGVNLVVYTRHVTGAETAYDWRLADGIVAPKTDAEKIGFFLAYGDSFISSLETGSEYYAVYSFYTQTAEEQQTLKTEMAANGIFEGGSFGADFQSKVDKFVSKTKVRVSMDQMITGLRNPTLPKANEIVDYALKFTSIEPDAPAIIRCEATGYEHLPGFGDYQPIANNRTYFLGNGFTPGVYDSLLKIDGLYNSLTWLLKTYSSYGGFKDATAEKVLSEATNDQNALHEQVSRYNTNPLDSFTKPALTSLTHGSPQLQYVSGWSDHWGNNGGGAFDDVDPTSFMQRITRIKAVQLRTGYKVDAISTTYADATGRQWTASHGGSGGGSGPQLSLLEDERVVSITGRYNDYVNRLSLQTNLDRTLSGGLNDGRSFTWKVPDGSFLLGFRGRSGTMLDQIQMIYASFKPAAWLK